MARIFRHRYLRWFAALLGILLLLCLLAVGGALLWLGSERSDVYIADLVTRELAKQGIYLKMDAFRVPSVQRLEARGVHLSDEKGEWLSAESLELNLHAAALLRKSLDVSLLHVQGASMHRLPELAPSESDQPGDDTPFSLPVAVLLDDVRIEKSFLAPAVLGLGPEQAGNMTPMALELTGKAYGFQRRFTADITASLLHPDGSGIRAVLKLGDADSEQAAQSGQAVRSRLPADLLELAVEVSEGRGGYLSRLVSDPAFPAYALRLDGRGLLRDWRGEVRFITRDQAAAPDPNGAEAEDDLSSGTITLALAAPDDVAGFSVFTNPRWRAQVQALVRAGTAAPAETRHLLAPELRADFAATTEPGLYRVERLSLGAASWNVRVEQAEARTSAESETEITATISAQVLDSDLFTALGTDAGLLDRATFTSDLSARIREYETDIRARGTATATTEGDDFALGYDADIGLDGDSVRIKSLGLSGLGVEAAVQAIYRQDLGEAEMDATLRADDRGAWQTLLARLAGEADGELLGGSVSGSVSARIADLPVPSDTDAADPTPPAAQSYPSVTASASLTGTRMRWPVDILDEVLGETVRIDLDVSGNGRDPYRAQIRRLEGANLTGQGNARFRPAPAMADSGLSADLSLILADASVLTGAEGPLTLALIADGRLGAIRADLTAESDRLSLGQAVYSGLRVRLDGIFDASGPDYGGKGQLIASALDGPSGPFRLESGFDLVAGSGTAFSISDLRLDGAGISARGQVRAEVPASGSVPVFLDGEIRLRLTDWRGVTALTGSRFTGSPAAVDITLARDGNTQNLRFSTDLRRLSLPGDETGEEDLHVERLRARGDINDLWNEPSVRITASMGRGNVENIVWTSGAFVVEGDGPDNRFDLLVSSQPGAASNLRLGPRSSASTPAEPLAGEVLSLSGYMNTASRTATLSRLVFQTESPSAGLWLREPVDINFAQGLTISPVNMSAIPSGEISLEASFQERESRVSIRIAELPLRLAQIVSDSSVPNGRASASLEMQRRGNAVEGEATVSATIIPEAMGDGSPGDGQPFTLRLAGNLATDPDPSFTHLRRVAGITRLKGTGSIVSYDHTEDAPDGSLVFDLPLRFSASGIPSLADTVPLGVRFTWQGALAPLWQLVPMADRQLSGTGRIAFTLAGTMDEPDHVLDAYVANGSFRDQVFGYYLTDIRLEAHNRQGGITRALLSAADGRGGTVAVEASVSRFQDRAEQAAGVNRTRSALIRPDAAQLAAREERRRVRRTSASPRRNRGLHLAVRGHVNHLEPLHRDDLSLRLSGVLAAVGPLAAPEITAKAVIERGELSLLNNFGSSIRTLPVVDADAPPARPPRRGPSCVIDIEVPNRFYIRGRGLDSEWAGNLHIAGPLNKTVLTGSLSPVRGTFDLLSRPFVFSDGSITFTGSEEINPAIDLELTYTGPSITAVVTGSGTAKRPKLTLSSRPQMPQDQIMSQVLFGKSASSLSRFEALQVANGLRELAGIGSDGLEPLTALRKKLGFDVLRIGSSGSGVSTEGRETTGEPGAGDLVAGANRTDGGVDDTGATPTLEAGKYINDAIYVGVDQGASGDSTGVRVEIELRPNLNLQGRSSARASEVGIGWKRDY